MKLTTKEQKHIDKSIAILKKNFMTYSIDASQSEMVIDYLKLNMGARDTEVFSVMFLNADYKLIEYKELFFGTANSIVVHPRVVAQECLRTNATHIIIAHNHPSGVADVSEEDIKFTKLVDQVLRLIDVVLVDHIIVAGDSSFSFAENDILP